MRQLRWFPSKTYKDVRICDSSNHCEYCCVWIDNLLYSGHDPTGLFQGCDGHWVQVEGVEPLTYRPRGDFKSVIQPTGVLSWGSTAKINNILGHYENMFGEAVLKHKIYAPLEPDDPHEVDESPLLAPKGSPFNDWGFAVGCDSLTNAHLCRNDDDAVSDQRP